MGINFIPLVVMVVPILTGSFGCAVGKRSIAGDDIVNNIDYTDYSPKYDESYMVVPKRAALLFDQFMIALQKIVDNQGKGSLGGEGVGKSVVHRMANDKPKVRPVADRQMMDLQRRGQTKPESFWPCFVNALACFKKK